MIKDIIMNYLEYIVLVVAFILVVLYFILGKKFPKIKNFLIGGFISLIGISLFKDKVLSKLQKKSLEDIGASKSNDEKRTDVVKEADEQIQKNKELIKEVEKVINEVEK